MLLCLLILVGLILLGCLIYATRGGVLSDAAILRAVRRGDIVITPFDRNALGGNSYDVHLASCLRTYATPELDCKLDNPTQDFEIPAEGFWLMPGRLYLARTIEYTESHRYIPILDGKSSVGRLGVWIHVTAGYGDVGFCGGWTLEIVVVHPVRVYVGMPIGQLRFHTVRGRVLRPYNQKSSAKYINAQDPKPQASRMYLNFPR